MPPAWVLGSAGALMPAKAASGPGSGLDSDPAVRKPFLVGANPGLQLFDPSGECTAYVSTWVVDWSVEGSGDVLVLWQPGQVRVLGDDRGLGLWLADYFVRNFPELEGLPWSPPRFERHGARVELDLERGLHVEAGDVSVWMRQVLDRRSFATDEFALAGVPHSLSLVLGPCGVGGARAAGRRLPGAVSVGGTTERPSSSAFLAVAEVWRR